jgi:hypothetical protein
MVISLGILGLVFSIDLATVGVAFVGLGGACGEGQQGQGQDQSAHHPLSALYEVAWAVHQ